MSKQQTYLTTLADLSTLLDTATDFPVALDQVMRRITVQTGADRGFLLLNDEASQEQPDPVGRAVVAQTVAENTAVLIQNSLDDARLAGLPQDERPPLSILCAPLRGQGAIYLDSQTVDRFEQADLDFLTAVANQMALARENGRLRQQMQADEQAGYEFVSLVTHELRLPLTAIKGYADLLGSGMAGQLNEQQQQFFSVIQRNLERMRQLISDLADLNRAESGRMKFDTKPLDLAPLIEAVVEQLRPDINGRQQTITITLANDLPQVHADPARVEQVLVNLLSNAHKYIPDGGQIRIEARPVAAGIQVDVMDNGPGISPADQEKLFTPFFRSEAPAVRAQPGWGLGLTVAQKILKAQGRAITFRSAPDEGSIFSFTLPISP
jgi:signal transduction histidine kinase